MIPVPPEAVTEALPLAERLVLQYALPEEIDAEEVRAFAVAMLGAAAPAIRAAERERIRLLARSEAARYRDDLEYAFTAIAAATLEDFADLLESGSS